MVACRHNKVSNRAGELWILFHWPELNPPPTHQVKNVLSRSERRVGGGVDVRVNQVESYAKFVAGDQVLFISKRIIPNQFIKSSQWNIFWWVGGTTATFHLSWASVTDDVLHSIIILGPTDRKRLTFFSPLSTKPLPKSWLFSRSLLREAAAIVRNKIINAKSTL